MFNIFWPTKSQFSNEEMLEWNFFEVCKGNDDKIVEEFRRVAEEDFEVNIKPRQFTEVKSGILVKNFDSDSNMDFG